MYSLRVSPAADRELDRLKRRIQRPDFERLRSVVRRLSGEPRPHGALKIRGREQTYRIRVGNYRVIYEVYDEERLVLILQVSRRTGSTYRRV